MTTASLTSPSPATTTTEPRSDIAQTTPPGATRPGLSACLHVEPWSDPLVEQHGHDPRSAYVETFWLPVVGPSTAWLLRRIATGFDHAPDGYSIDCAQLSSELGLGRSLSRNAAFVRSVERACKFGLAQRYEDQLYVRRRLPPLAPRHLRRLPERLQAVHDAWQQPDLIEEHERATAVAAALLNSGLDLNEAEQQLHRWGFGTTAAWEAVSHASGAETESLVLGAR